MKGDKLSVTQEKFVSELIKGESQRSAYRAAYIGSRKWKDSAVDSQACRLLKSPKVAARYSELIEKSSNKSIMSAIERKEWLTNLINDKVINIGDKLKALDILNKMSGEYITKTIADVNVTSYESSLLQVTDDEED